MTELGHSAPVSAVAAIGDQVVSGGYDGRLLLHRRRGSELVADREIGRRHARGVNAVALSSDAMLCASGGSDGVARIFGIDGSTMREIQQPVDVETVAFAADGSMLASGSTNGTAVLTNIEGGRQITVDHERTVGAAAWHGVQLVTGANDCAVRVIDRGGRVVSCARVADGPVKAIAVTRGGFFAASHDRTLRFVSSDLARNQILWTSTTTPKSISVTPDGSRLVVAAYDQVIRVFRIRGEAVAQEAEILCPRGWAHGLAVTDDLGALGAFGGLPIAFSLDERPRLLAHDDVEVPCISAAADLGHRILVAGDSGRIREVGHDVHPSADGPRLGSAITCLVAADDRELFAGTWAGEIVAITPSGGVHPVVSGLGCPVLRIACTSTHVIAGLYTGGAVGIDRRSGRIAWRMAESTGATKCLDALDHYTLAVGRYDPARLVESTTGRVLARHPLETPVSDVVAFRPRTWGRPYEAAIAAGDGEVWFVAIDETGPSPALRVLERAAGHDLPIKAIAWLSADSVIAGGYGGELLLHTRGRPSRSVARLPGRLGVSAILVVGHELVVTTFDGTVHRHPTEGLR